ncbi:hypothetical protein A2U01_0074947, partial [Trifolium medium]|nr:hypothetical protein [Trifolium medium]
MKLKTSLSSPVVMQSYNLIADAPQIWSNEFLTEADAPSPSFTSVRSPPAVTPASEWSDQVVTEVVKGVELEYTKILKL